LKSVLGVVRVEQAAADTPNHRAVPPHEGGEGGFVPMLDEAPEQLAIGQPGPVSQKDGPAKVFDDLAHGTRRHVLSLAGVISHLLSTICRTEVV
jgi:hypothetical protein